jgi:hypothetical protein|tara:strand:+ start:12972 stop:13634 length:663 start_codon:yes stop_codon:yes gene_type:complete
MGVEDNEYQIPNLDSNTSFFDWYTKENDEIISKLNKLFLYDLDTTGSLAQGISAALGTTSAGVTSGFVTVGIADTIPHGVTFQGTHSDVCVTSDGSIAYTYTATAATAGLTGKFVCLDSTGGITASFAAATGVTTDPYHKNETIGIVDSIQGNSVKIVSHGFYAGFTGLTAGQAYYLDPVVAGGYTLNAPSTTGQTKKRLFVSLGSTFEGIVQIGDSDIV